MIIRSFTRRPGSRPVRSWSARSRSAGARRSGTDRCCERTRPRSSSARSPTFRTCAACMSTRESRCCLKDRVSLGHRATVHGAHVESGALIGMGAIVLGGARVGAWHAGGCRGGRAAGHNPAGRRAGGRGPVPDHQGTDRRGPGGVRRDARDATGSAPRGTRQPCGPAKPAYHPGRDRAVCVRYRQGSTRCTQRASRRVVREPADDAPRVVREMVLMGHARCLPRS